MNDRYLFRAKRIDNGEWVEGCLLALDDETYRIATSCLQGNAEHLLEVCAYEVDPSTICQCTGLKDKNGKKIWENDVVKKEFYTDYDAFANSEEYIGVVKYEDCAWVIETKRNNLICTRPIIESMAYSDDVKHFEVIGNIFDNTEIINE